MKRLFTSKKILPLLSLFVCVGYSAIAQNISDRPFPVDTIVELFHSNMLNAASFGKERIGTPFPPLDSLKPVNNPGFNINTTNRPTLIFIGSKGPSALWYTMPCFIKVANDKKYAAYTFVYLTTDDLPTITSELKDIKPDDLKKIKIVMISKKQVDKKRLLFKYHTLYFLNSNRQIADISLGYAFKVPDKRTAIDSILNDLRAKLDVLK